jgi:putative PIG3 family NAD(P)H quinone oxidoreductase
MKAVLFEKPGGPEVLAIGDAPEPTPGRGEVLIEVAATAVNRADAMQRLGHYPPPPGASSILGLEAAGRIAAFGPEALELAPHLAIGQPAMALLSGGGYAERVAVPVGQVMPIPDGLTQVQAAAIPEVFLTAYLNLFGLGGLSFGIDRRSLSVLVHGGASGVGTAAIQLCRAAGAVVYCTVGDDERARECEKLGAALAWNYKTRDFVAAVLEATENRGVDLILDCIGGDYLERNLRALAPDGRLVCIGLQGGSRAELDLGLLLRRRLQIIGSTLRPLPVARKAQLCAEFAAKALPLFSSGVLRPIIDRVLPLSAAAEAHRALQEAHLGKIVLRVAE